MIEMAQGIKTGGRDFQKGQSGNPGGAPRGGLSVAEIIRNFLSGKEGKKQRAEIMVAALFDKARDGDVQACKFLVSYSDGLPVQRTETEFTSSIVRNPEWLDLRHQLVTAAKSSPEVSELLEGVLNGNGAN